MAKKEKIGETEPKRTINATIRIVKQEGQDSRTPKSELGLLYLEKITSLLKVILWPLITIIIVAIFWTPISHIIGILPSTLSETSKLSIGEFSLELRQQAITQGYPELADRLGGLSVNALNVLFLTDDVGDYGLVSYNSDQTEFYLPNQTYLGGLMELEEKGLIAFKSNSQDWLNVFRGLDLKPTTVTWLKDYRTAYTITRPLSEAEKKPFTSNYYWLTESGKAARMLVIQTISQLLSSSNNK
jgi:hypothetical protein